MSSDQTANDSNEDRAAQKSAADSLRHRIEQLRSGAPPRTLHEFIVKAMSEDKPDQNLPPEPKDSPG